MPKPGDFTLPVTFSGEKEPLQMQGYSAVYANNRQYIAYVALDHRLTIREMTSGTEWKGGQIATDSQYLFSADDNYVAFDVQTYNRIDSPMFELHVWDYRKGKELIYRSDA